MMPAARCPAPARQKATGGWGTDIYMADPVAAGSGSPPPLPESGQRRFGDGGGGIRGGFFCSPRCPPRFSRRGEQREQPQICACPPFPKRMQNDAEQFLCSLSGGAKESAPRRVCAKPQVPAAEQKRLAPGPFRPACTPWQAVSTAVTAGRR